MEIRKASMIASQYIDLIQPYTSRIEIAGSVRRRKPEVHDLELVAIVEDLANLDFKLTWEHGARLIKGGGKYRQYALREEINLDLFLVSPPAQWGVIMLIRTGPAEFSQMCVTQRNKGGLLPSFASVRDGAVWNPVNILPMPEEIDFLNFLELGWIDPWERN
jgi:DNA polymerase/3'-5' exonuclease PolX